MCLRPKNWYLRELRVQLCVSLLWTSVRCTEGRPEKALSDVLCQCCNYTVGLTDTLRWWYWQDYRIGTTEQQLVSEHVTQLYIPTARGPLGTLSAMFNWTIQERQSVLESGGTYTLPSPALLLSSPSFPFPSSLLFLHLPRTRIEKRLCLLNDILTVKCERSWNYWGTISPQKYWGNVVPRPPWY